MDGVCVCVCVDYLVAQELDYVLMILLLVFGIGTTFRKPLICSSHRGRLHGCSYGMNDRTCSSLFSFALPSIAPRSLGEGASQKRWLIVLRPARFVRSRNYCYVHTRVPTSCANRACCGARRRRCTDVPFVEWGKRQPYHPMNTNSSNYWF